MVHGAVTIFHVYMNWQMRWSRGAWIVGASIIKKGVANKNFTEAFVGGVQPLLQGFFVLSGLDVVGVVRKSLGVA